MVGGIVGWVPPVAATTPVSITTEVEAGVTDVAARATLAGGDDPTGNVTFRVFGPGDDTYDLHVLQPHGHMSFALFGPGAPTCTGTPVFTSSRPVQGNGSYTSDPFVPTTPGTYRWGARYSGDADDPGAATPCDDPAQRVEVRAADASSPGNQCTVRARAWSALAAYRQLLQGLGDNPIAALLGRLSGLTACLPGMPAG